MSDPLINRTIVITRSEEQSESAKNIFEDLGAKVIHFPTIKITDPESFEPFDDAIKQFNEYDFLIFTSVNAVHKFIERITALNILLDFNNKKVIVTGSKTAEVCRENNIKVDFIPESFTAEGIITNLQIDYNNKNVLIPCSAIARDELKDGLVESGADVTKVSIYDVRIPELNEIKDKIEILNKNKPDLFVFTSPSTFMNFLTIMKIDNPKKYFQNYTTAAIGTTTESAINNFDINVDIVPDKFTMESLADAVLNYFEKIDLSIKQ